MARHYVTGRLFVSFRRNCNTSELPHKSRRLTESESEIVDAGCVTVQGKFIKAIKIRP